jgi:hypothetical protein
MVGGENRHNDVRIAIAANDEILIYRMRKDVGMKITSTQVGPPKPIGLSKKRIGAGQQEAKEKNEDKMMWTGGDQP